LFFFFVCDLSLGFLSAGFMFCLYISLPLFASPAGIIYPLGFLIVTVFLCFLLLSFPPPPAAISSSFAVPLFPLFFRTFSHNVFIVSLSPPGLNFAPGSVDFVSPVPFDRVMCLLLVLSFGPSFFSVACFFSSVFRPLRYFFPLFFDTFSRRIYFAMRFHKDDAPPVNDLFLFLIIPVLGLYFFVAILLYRLLDPFFSDSPFSIHTPFFSLCPPAVPGDIPLPPPICSYFYLDRCPRSPPRFPHICWPLTLRRLTSIHS